LQIAKIIRSETPVEIRRRLIAQKRETPHPLPLLPQGEKGKSCSSQLTN
jgi:hypothetical protein